MSERFACPLRRPCRFAAPSASFNEGIEARAGKACRLDDTAATQVGGQIAERAVGLRRGRQDERPADRLVRRPLSPARPGAKALATPDILSPQPHATRAAIA